MTKDCSADAAGIVASAVTPFRQPAKKSNLDAYRMVNKGADRGEIWLYGLIGLGKDNWLGIDGITAKQFAEDLRKLGAVKTIDLRINSDGGVVDDARAIYNLLVDHPANVTSHIDGIAASAASFIAMAGSTIKIAEGGYVMIHDARGGAYGTADDLEKMVGVFRSYNDTIRATYRARTGQPDDKLKAWMKEETWFDGKDAVKYGFADAIVENHRIAACIHDEKRFANLPPALRANRIRAEKTLADIRKSIRA